MEAKKKCKEKCNESKFEILAAVALLRALLFYS